VFFIGDPIYRILGLFDLVFLLPEALLLFAATRGEAAGARAS
jgi:hypothetical protein